MKDECQDAMAQALGRALKPSEAKDVEDAVKLHMRLLATKDVDAWRAMGPQQRLEAGATAAAQAIIDELKLKQQRVALQITTHDRIAAALDEALGKVSPPNVFARMREKLTGTPAEAGVRTRLVGDLVAFNAAGHGLTSTETWQRSLSNEAFGDLMPLLTSIKGFTGLFDSKQGISDLVHELFGENSGNAAAKEGAAAWAKVTEDLRKRSIDAGMNIGKLEDWRFPQNWSTARLVNAGIDQFTNDMLQHLDRSKYLHPDGSGMNDDEMTRILHNVWDTITTDGANKTAAEFKRQTLAGEPSATYTGGDAWSGILANRGSAHRVLFFKDADSYLAAHGNYGESSLYPTLVGHINSITRNLGLAETWGPNAEQAYRYFADKAAREDRQAERGAGSRIDHLGAINDAMFDMAMGRRDVVNQTVADIGQGVRNFETAVKLPKVIFSALGDYAGMASTAFANRVPFSEVFLGEMHALNPLAAEDRAVAEHAGLGINRVLGHLNRFGTEDFQTGGGSKAAAFRDFTSKLASGVLNATGQEAIWDARRKGLGSIIQSYLGKTVQQVEHFADLNVQDHGILAHKGVSESDWQVWRQAQGEDWGLKHSVLTPKSIYAIPDEQLAQFGDPTDLKRHAATMLLGHTMEEMGMGVMDSGIRQRAGKMLGTAGGTPSGELLRSALLFKSFAFAMTGKHWARMMDLPPAMSWKYGATLATVGTVMGALGLQLRNISNGKDPENMASPSFWGSAVLKGGGLGFYGDFLYDEATSNDTSLAAGLMGPVASDLEQVHKLTAGYGFAKAKGEFVGDERAKVLRFARSEIPLLNLWYLQAAADHLLWNNMQEAVSPGYLDRMQERAYNDRGTSYWWDPHDATPAKAPDLAQAWQPERGADQLRHMADLVGMNQ